jgi:hypothetical protein
MSEIIIQSKTIALTLITTVVIAIIVGVIGYNLGVANGLKSGEKINFSVTPEQATNKPATTNNQPTNANTPAVSPTPTEIPLSGEPVSVEGKTIITGKINGVSTTGFTLSVTSQIINTATRNVTEKITDYKIKITPSTKITEYVSTVTIPAGAGTPQITQSTKKLLASELKNEQSVTVVSADDLKADTLTALEIRVSTMVRK